MRHRYSNSPRDRYRRQVLMERIENQGLDPNDFPNIFEEPTQTPHHERKQSKTRESKAHIKKQRQMQDEHKFIERLAINGVEPITDTQDLVFDEFSGADRNMLIYGCAGTGKSFLAIYRALKAVIIEKTHRKVVIIRSPVQTRDVGFLPGKTDEKMAAFETTYGTIVNDIFDNPAAYTILKQNGLVEFSSTAFLRGMTYDDCVVVVDECQSMNFHELSTVITRVGDNTKIYFCGDFEQDDLIKNKYDQSGLGKFLSIVQKMASFAVFEMGEDDIVRSGVVREFIIAKRQVEKTEK